MRVDVDPSFLPSIKSQFGSGIVTFSPPWLFRTAPGWNLYVKGPSNRWKANCVALEGVIETWWLNYTFTINWKLVEPGSVVFAKGESLAQLVPVPHETFAGASAWEAPIGFVEPQAGQELLNWLEQPRQIASEAVSIHRLYRAPKAYQGIFSACRCRTSNPTTLLATILRPRARPAANGTRVFKEMFPSLRLRQRLGIVNDQVVAVVG